MNFKDYVKHWTKQKKISQAELARAADILPTHLSEMIKGKRACSPAVATKLARHLGLIDNDLRDFLTAASTTCKQNLWQRGIDPTTFKNYIAEYMSKQEGVTSDDIANIHIERKGRGRDPDMVLTDKAGRQFVVEIKVTRK